MRETTNHEQALAYRFAHLPLPDDAVECGPWLRRGDDDWRRHFLSREWEVAGLWVSVAGEQRHDGTITRWVHVGGDDRCSSSDRTKLIAALIEAGRLFDSLKNEDGDRVAVGQPVSGARRLRVRDCDA